MHADSTPSTTTSVVTRGKSGATISRPSSVRFSPADYHARLAARVRAESRSPKTNYEPTRYKFNGELGKGSYGVVYRGLSASGRGVALKMLPVDEDDGLAETCVREIILLHDLNQTGLGHPNILQLMDVIVRQEKIYLATSLLDMDLRSWIKVTPTATRLQYIKRLGRCLLNGVLHIHRRGIMHRDLKPHNVLISHDLREVKIGDFGLARYRHDENKTLTHEVVTLWYRAPEILLGECHYSEAIDIWSIGCILGEAWLGRPLFGGDSEIDTLFKIFVLLGTPPSKFDWPKDAFEQFAVFPTFKGKSLSSLILPSDASSARFTSSFISLLSKMLQICPHRRSDAIACLRHPFLQQLA